MNTQTLQRAFRHLMNDPFLDWVLILGISAVVTIALVAVSVSVYLETESRLSAPASPIVSSHVAFDPNLLKAVLDSANMRAAIWSDHAVHYPVAPDPSLP